MFIIQWFKVVLSCWLLLSDFFNLISITCISAKSLETSGNYIDSPWFRFLPCPCFERPESSDPNMGILTVLTTFNQHGYKAIIGE